MSNQKYFAVLQVGCGIYGVGKSIDEAIKDAIFYANDVSLHEKLVNPSDAMHRELCLVECSETLFKRVIANEVNIKFSVINNSLICLDSELKEVIE